MMIRRLCLLALTLTLLGCGDTRGTPEAPPLTGAEISNVTFGRALALTDHNGRRVSLETFRGRWVMLFFGYTRCPDVCPTTLSDMARAFELLGPEAAGRVQVLFVTVDPERDSKDILKAYVPYFHPDFLGLWGTPEEVARVAREFRVVYRKHVEPGASDYLVDHSAGSYLLDPDGRLRVYWPFAHPPEDKARDLQALMQAH